MAKGDWIEVIYRTGVGVSSDHVAATQNGRTLAREFEKDGNVNWMTISEFTRGGTLVRKNYYRADEILAVSSGPFNASDA